MVKEGSIWYSADGKRFHVIHRVEIDGHAWVHYIEENKENCREYSCYEESFLLRFRPYVNA
jgi:hypothetical protein